jgi:hypothetical protein
LPEASSAVAQGEYIVATMTSKLPSYPALETDATLPADIRAIANARHPVVTWTALDPSREAEVDGYAFNVVCGFVPPCFWPCLFGPKVNLVNSIRGQYWILTETELKVIVTRHDASCIPGCHEVGDVVQTIPLENITDCGVIGRAQSLLNRSLPGIYVDTASVRPGQGHEATGIALAAQERFVQAVLNQRDNVKGGQAAGTPSAVVTTTAAAATAYPVMERGAERPAAERIKEITALYESEVITKDEFDRKRQEIIDSI